MKNGITPVPKASTPQLSGVVTPLFGALGATLVCEMTLEYTHCAVLCEAEYPFTSRNLRNTIEVWREP